MEKITISKDFTASFDIDAQKGFTPLCPNELPVPGGDEIVNKLNIQSKFAKYRIGSKDCHPSNSIWIATKDKPQFTPVEGENVDIRWNAHCMSGTRGAELLDGLPKVSEYDYFVFKGTEPDLHPYSPIYHDLKKTLSTGIIEWAINNNVDTFIIGGLALNFCLGEGAFDLKKAGFNVIVNLEATKGLGSEKELEKYISSLKDVGIIIIENSTYLKNI